MLIAMTAACSDKEIATGGTDVVKAGFNEEGDGYMRISLNLPVMSNGGSRAATSSDPNYEDGTPNEYKVEDATLLLFSGANEQDAYFRTAYDLTKDFLMDDNHNQITATHDLVQLISKAGMMGESSEDEHIYAYVILNKNNLFTINEDHTLKITTTDIKKNNDGTYGTSLNGTIYGSRASIPADETAAPTIKQIQFKDFAQLMLTGQTNAVNLKSHSFFMSNAPIVTITDASRDDFENGLRAPVLKAVTTLIEVDKSRIYPTRAQAESNLAAATIYVERAVAKVTVEDAATEKVLGEYVEHTENGDVTHKLVAVLDRFMVDQTAKDTYLTRYIPSSTRAATTERPTNLYNWATYFSNAPAVRRMTYTENPFRFIEREAINTAKYNINGEEEKVYRIQWGIDPTYYASTNDGNNANLYNVRPALSVYDATADVEISNKIKTTIAEADAPVYCLENTFDVDRMKDNQTTRIIIMAKYKEETYKNNVLQTSNNLTEFYTDTKNNAQSVAMDETALKVHLKKIIMQTPEFQQWKRDHTTSIPAGTDIISDITLGYFNGTYQVDANGQPTGDITQIGKYETTKRAGYVKVTAITYNYGNVTFKSEGTHSSTDTPAPTADDLFSQMSNVTKYYKDYGYYPVKIKHFGDYQTPWSVTSDGAIQETPSPSVVNVTYPYPGSTVGTPVPAEPTFDDYKGREANYLGRFGVLRNTWYDIKVKTVKSIGEPTIPTVTPGGSQDGKDDDSLDQYISVEIRILPWAKRTQNAEL